MPSQYRLAPSLIARLLGGLVVLAGALVLLLALLVALTPLPGAVLTVGVVVAVLLVVVGGGVLARGGTVLELDATGYRVGWLRSAGVRRARWRDVEDVVTATLSGQDCIVLRLRDGRTTTLPVAVVGARPEALVRDLGEHLNRGHGYRPLR